MKYGEHEIGILHIFVQLYYIKNIYLHFEQVGNRTAYVIQLKGKCIILNTQNPRGKVTLNYQNIKETIWKTNVGTWFNKICKSG